MTLFKFTVLLITSTLALSVTAQEARKVPVQFARGASSASIKGSVSGEQSVSYQLRAQAGQVMQIDLATNNASSYYNLYGPGSAPGDQALYSAAVAGLQCKYALPKEGLYTINVFLMRNAARRNEKADYTIDIGIGKADKKAVMKKTSSIKWPTDTDASGELACSAGKPGYQDFSPFKVKRNKFGATVWVIKPGENSSLRVLYFENKKFTTDDKSTIESQRVGDDWLVNVNDKEFYRIADAVIFGG